jgi:hypothetical protein
MPVRPPRSQTRIVVTAPRPKPSPPAVAIPVWIVHAPRKKQKDAWKRFLQLTGRERSTSKISEQVSVVPGVVGEGGAWSEGGALES